MTEISSRCTRVNVYMSKCSHVGVLRVDWRDSKVQTRAHWEYRIGSKKICQNNDVSRRWHALVGISLTGPIFETRLIIKPFSEKHCIYMWLGWRMGGRGKLNIGHRCDSGRENLQVDGCWKCWKYMNPSNLSRKWKSELLLFNLIRVSSIIHIQIGPICGGQLEKYQWSFELGFSVRDRTCYHGSYGIHT